LVATVLTILSVHSQICVYVHIRILHIIEMLVG